MWGLYMVLKANNLITMQQNQFPVEVRTKVYSEIKKLNQTFLCEKWLVAMAYEYFKNEEYKTMYTHEAKHYIFDSFKNKMFAYELKQTDLDHMNSLAEIIAKNAYPRLLPRDKPRPKRPPTKYMHNTSVPSKEEIEKQHEYNKLMMRQKKELQKNRLQMNINTQDEIRYALEEHSKNFTE